MPRNARACPECGADHRSGWSENSEVAGLDLPENEFRYDDWGRAELSNSPKPATIKSLWWIVAMILLIGFLLSYLLAAMK